VIAAYQVAQYAPESVASALAQTRGPHEVIVVDDGSTDGLADALQPFEPKIELIRQPNRGPAAARNTAVRAASGEYIVILDADDSWLPERLARIGATLALRPDLDILTTDAWVEHDGQILGRHAKDFTPFAVEGQRRAILRYDFLFPHCAVRRRAWVDAGGMREEHRTGEDWDLWRRLILDGCVAGMVDEPLARYRVREDSVSQDREGALADRITLHLLALDDPRLTRDEQQLVRAQAARERLRLAALSVDRCLPCARRRLIDVIVHRPLLHGVRARLWAARQLIGQDAPRPPEAEWRNRRLPQAS
jgi:glycosyltransferase involved in cell wall biosynthesis